MHINQNENNIHLLTHDLIAAMSEARTPIMAAAINTASNASPAFIII